jgi:hypothetical protein
MPHYVHIKPVAVKPSPKMLASPKAVNKKVVHDYNRMLWRKRCFAEHRLRMMRDVNLCSAYRATLRWFNNVSFSNSKKSELGEAVNYSQWTSSPFFLYDIWAETRTTLGLEFVDILGHHYQDLFLESVSTQLLGTHVCPADDAAEDSPGCPSRLCLADGHAACARLETISKSYVIEKECACHNIAARSALVCKKYGRGVPDLSSRN